MSYLTLENVQYTYDKSTAAALTDLNLSIEQGEFVVIIGPSGSGKSTLLGLLAGLERPRQGRVCLSGQEIIGPGLDRGVVFQHYSLFPWMTAAENIRLGIRQSAPDKTKAEIDQSVSESLQKVGLAEAGHKYPYQLSGGMQQRVAIARTLAMNNQILLLDEPFGAIDPKKRSGLQTLLEDIWNSAQGNKTVIFVTHDIDEAILLADRILYLENGRITQEYQINLPRPRNMQSAIGHESFCGIRQKLLALFREEEAAG